MASDLQKKSKQTVEAGVPPVTEQQPNRHPVTSDASPFTAEQRQILGNVYQLILSWRRERLMKTTPQSALNSSSMLLTEREA
jgi:hypothetical protein